MPPKFIPTRLLKNQWKNALNTFHEFPAQFWILISAAFIDRLGGAMLFPFFTLYLTRKFGINMTQVGIIFVVFSISSVVGGVIGGAMTDRLGRKSMLIFGLVMSALSALLMGFINEIVLFTGVVLVVGTLADTGGPAQQALVADLLPEDKRTQGFGILRVVFNLAVVIGPLIGGLLATQSYLLLFIVDAIASTITAVIVYFTLKETWRPQESGKPTESMAQTFAGYFDVLGDKAFVWYLAASALMVLVYMQMNTTLAVYLRDYHSVNELGWSYILSLNAAMVVLFQFPITRWITRYRPLVVMTVGTLLYAIGFAMYGMFAWYGMFLLAMVIITIGEMLVSPVGQAIVTRLAPEDKRGRYMAVSGFSWILPFAIGPLLAGLIMDNMNPNWLWYISGLLGIAAAGAFYGLEWLVNRAKWNVIDQRLRIIEQLEEGQISAETAGQMLEKIGESAWAKLAPKEEEATAQRRHLRIRVSDLSSGAMKVDLRLPMGLLNTILYATGQVSADLDSLATTRLKEMLIQGAFQDSQQQLDADGNRMEVSLE